MILVSVSGSNHPLGLTHAITGQGLGSALRTALEPVDDDKAEPEQAYKREQAEMEEICRDV